MKAAIKFNEAEELKLRSAALTEQAMEQVSGGAGPASSVSLEKVKKVLVSAVKDLLDHTTIKKAKTFEEFWSDILYTEGYHVCLRIYIWYYSQRYYQNDEVIDEYNTWTQEEQKAALKAVWALI